MSIDQGPPHGNPDGERLQSTAPLPETAWFEPMTRRVQARATQRFAGSVFVHKPR